MVVSIGWFQIFTYLAYQVENGSLTKHPCKTGCFEFQGWLGDQKLLPFWHVSGWLTFPADWNLLSKHPKVPIGHIGSISSGQSILFHQPGFSFSVRPLVRPDLKLASLGPSIVKPQREASALMAVCPATGWLCAQQPGFSWNKGISLPWLPFGLRSCEVAIIWSDIINYTAFQESALSSNLPFQGVTQMNLIHETSGQKIG